MLADKTDLIMTSKVAINRASRLIGSHDLETRRQLYLGVDGRMWDVSNLSPTLSQNEQRLYPSLRDIPEENGLYAFGKDSKKDARMQPALHDERLQQVRTSTYEERLQRLAAQTKGHVKRSDRKSKDFRQEYIRILKKPAVKNVDAATREECNDDQSQASVQSVRNEEPKPKPIKSDMRMEISPGHFVPIHGADETEEAIARDHVLSTVCSCCSRQLFCIANAEFVICPTCREISPVDFNTLGNFGIGLGLTPETLRREKRNLRM